MPSPVATLARTACAARFNECCSNASRAAAATSAPDGPAWWRRRGLARGGEQQQPGQGLTSGRRVGEGRRGRVSSMAVPDLERQGERPEVVACGGGGRSVHSTRRTASGAVGSPRAWVGSRVPLADQAQLGGKVQHALPGRREACRGVRTGRLVLGRNARSTHRLLEVQQQRVLQRVDIVARHERSTSRGTTQGPGPPSGRGSISSSSVGITPCYVLYKVAVVSVCMCPRLTSTSCWRLASGRSRQPSSSPCRRIARRRGRRARVRPPP